MNKRNFQRELEGIIAEQQQRHNVPRLLLHSCCAPCSSYVLEYLNRFFSITVFYYNPNIHPESEYSRRVAEIQRLIATQPAVHPVSFIEGDFNPGAFHSAIAGHESDREGGGRCFICYRLRLREAARVAQEGQFDYFTTTLTISPLKNAPMLNQIGEELSQEFGVEFLPSDFKKKGGYLRSIELSRLYELYRQDYCGCVYSLRRDMEMKKKEGNMQRQEDETTQAEDTGAQEYTTATTQISDRK